MTHKILPAPNPVPSYWLSEPHPLADLRSTPRLPVECDIAVIGAGLAGVLSAYHILRTLDKSEESSGDVENEATKNGLARPKVVLLDARRLCEGATGRNGGHVKVQVSTLLGLAGEQGDAGMKRTGFQEYVARVVNELKRVVEEEAIECEFELRRSFDVFTDAGDAEGVYQQYETARQKGEQWTSNVIWIGPEAAEQVTTIRGAKGAFSVPAASFWPYKFVAGLLDVMHQRWGASGALNVQMCTPVTSLSSPDTSPHLLTTDRGALTASNVVLATNAYTAGLLPLFRNRILPVRGMASHHTPSHPVHPHLNNTYNINFGPGKGVDYLNPRPDGGIVVGGGAWLFKCDEASWRDNWDDAHLFSADVMAYWRDYMQERFLGWGDSGAENDFVWTGIMGRTADGLPFVGRVLGKDKMWVLAGFNGGGMALIAVCARAVGRMVCDGKGFEDVWVEEGLLEGMGCCKERLRDGVS